MTSGGGLRERKKAATRQALHEAAVRLTLAYGLDRVTVEAIADAAMVSRRTFSNYFGGKEQALLYDHRRRMDELVAFVRARPDAEPPWAALTAAAVDLCEGLDDHDIARMRLIREYTGLNTEAVALFASLERDLAAAVAVRLPGDDELRARVVASSYLTALRVASTSSEDHPDRGTLLDQVLRALAVAAEPFT
jgi:AcrR family transcriptional regulator